MDDPPPPPAPPPAPVPPLAQAASFIAMIVSGVSFLRGWEVLLYIRDCWLSSRPVPTARAWVKFAKKELLPLPLEAARLPNLSRRFKDTLRDLPKRVDSLGEDLDRVRRQDISHARSHPIGCWIYDWDGRRDMMRTIKREPEDLQWSFDMVDRAILARNIAALRAKHEAVVRDRADPLPGREARRVSGWGKKVGDAIRMVKLR